MLSDKKMKDFLSLLYITLDEDSRQDCVKHWLSHLTLLDVFITFKTRGA